MPESHKRIVTLTTNPSVERSCDIERLEMVNKLRCTAPRREPGGGGVNVTRAIHRLGGVATAVLPVGGAMGEVLLEMLRGEPLDLRTTAVSIETRENLTVFEESREAYYRFMMPGWPLTAEELAEVAEAAFTGEKPEYLVVSGSLPPQAPQRYLADLATRCRKAGVKLVLDATGKPFRRAMDEGVYLVKPNRRELEDLVGREVADDEDVESAAMQVIEGGQAEVVIVSLGAAGAMVATEERSEFIRAPLVQVRCRIGAGDSMVAGIVLALARGQSVEEAARLGVAAGSSAVMAPGPELCRRDDTQRFYERLTSHGVTGR